MNLLSWTGVPDCLRTSKSSASDRRTSYLGTVYIPTSTPQTHFDQIFQDQETNRRTSSSCSQCCGSGVELFRNPTKNHTRNHTENHILATAALISTVIYISTVVLYLDNSLYLDSRLDLDQSQSHTQLAGLFVARRPFFQLPFRHQPPLRINSLAASGAPRRCRNSKCKRSCTRGHRKGKIFWT